jgi:hypothetical protein
MEVTTLVVIFGLGYFALFGVLVAIATLIDLIKERINKA